MKAIILAAGYGTRAYPLTKNRAKPLLPLRGKPIIEHIINKVQLLEDIDEVFIITNHRFFRQFNEWLGNFANVAPINLIDDGSFSLQDKLGAIKDLAYGIEKANIDDDLLIVGGDNLFSFSLQDFIDVAKNKGPHILIGLYNLNGRLKPNKFGIAALDSSGKVIEFYEKPENLNGFGLVSMCLYFFPKEKLSLIKEYLSKPPLPNGERVEVRGSIGAYIEWLSRKDAVYGYSFEEGDWISIRDADAYTEVVFTF